MKKKIEPSCKGFRIHNFASVSRLIDPKVSGLDVFYMHAENIAVRHWIECTRCGYIKEF